MPLFDYKCDSCDNVFSELRGIAEKDNSIECPHCGTLTSNRMFTGFSIGSTTSNFGKAESMPTTCPSAASCGQECALKGG